MDRKLWSLGQPADTRAPGDDRDRTRFRKAVECPRHSMIRAGDAIWRMEICANQNGHMPVSNAAIGPVPEELYAKSITLMPPQLLCNTYILLSRCEATG